MSDIEYEFNDDLSGSDLDIPGSELDHNLELIGSEGEENNYYSIGEMIITSWMRIKMNCRRK